MWMRKFIHNHILYVICVVILYQLVSSQEGVRCKLGLNVSSTVKHTWVIRSMTKYFWLFISAFYGIKRLLNYMSMSYHAVGLLSLQIAIYFTATRPLYQCATSSRACQNFHEDVLLKLNVQIKLEYEASYVYQAMVRQCIRENVAVDWLGVELAGRQPCLSLRLARLYAPMSASIAWERDVGLPAAALPAQCCLVYYYLVLVDLQPYHITNLYILVFEHRPIISTELMSNCVALASFSRSWQTKRESTH